MVIGILLCISVLINGILGYAVMNAAKQVNTYDEFCELLLIRVRLILNDLRKVDESGAFEADDQVGIVFAGIRSLVETLQTFLPEGEPNGQTQE